MLYGLLTYGWHFGSKDTTCKYFEGLNPPLAHQGVAEEEAPDAWIYAGRGTWGGRGASYKGEKSSGGERNCGSPAVFGSQFR